MGLQRQISAYLILLLFLSPMVSAWCVLGVGNTCGDRATEPHSTFIGSVIYNNDDPQEDNDDIGISILGLTNELRLFKDQPASSYDDTRDVEADEAYLRDLQAKAAAGDAIAQQRVDEYNANKDNPDYYIPRDQGSKTYDVNDLTRLDDGDSTTIIDDSGNSYRIHYDIPPKYEEIVVKQYEALWYDVDVVDSSLRCPSCLTSTSGEKLYTAGFDYLFDLILVNGGNTVAEGVQLEITIRTLDQVVHYNFNSNALNMLPGQYTIDGLIFPRFGIDEYGRIKNEYLHTGLSSKTFDIEFIAKLSRSNGVSEPRVQLVDKIKRNCGWYGGDFECYERSEKEIREFCPDGSSYNGVFSCGLNDPKSQNELDETFTLLKLSPMLKGEITNRILSG